MRIKNLIIFGSARYSQSNSLIEQLLFYYDLDVRMDFFIRTSCYELIAFFILSSQH